MDIEADIQATIAQAHFHSGVRPSDFNPAGIKVAIQPSNLTAPTRLSEKYAPDSCVSGLELKYVYADRELLSAKPRELVLKSNQETTEKVRIGNEIPSFPGSKPLIPGLILYERPAWKRSEVLENLLQTSVPASLHASKSVPSASIPPQPEPKPVPKPVKIQGIKAPKTGKKTSGKGKTVRKVQVEIAQPKVSFDSVSKEINRETPNYVAPKKMHSTKKPHKKQEKTVKMYPGKQELGIESTGSMSISDNLISSDSANRWLESKQSGSILKGKDEFSPEKSELDLEEKKDWRYEDARTTKHVHYEDEQKPRPEESIRQLEEMVEEQHRYLVQHGYLSPQSSSNFAASRQKTYEDLESEIQNIKNLLGEHAPDHYKDEESGSQLTYSSDEGEEPEDDQPEEDEWMSPRFTQ